jgi:hypothetical protein
LDQSRESRDQPPSAFKNQRRNETLDVVQEGLVSDMTEGVGRKESLISKLSRRLSKTKSSKSNLTTQPLSPTGHHRSGSLSQVFSWNRNQSRSQVAEEIAPRAKSLDISRGSYNNERDDMRNVGSGTKTIDRPSLIRSRM